VKMKLKNIKVILGQYDIATAPPEISAAPFY
jgi:hypothetical protein